MRMATGTGDLTGGGSVAESLPMKKLLLCFIAVYERQILCRAFTYMFHNQLEDEDAFNSSVKRSLVYSTLSPLGIAAELRPYLQHAQALGYLLPDDCNDNPFALRALSLYPRVHEAWTRLTVNEQGDLAPAGEAGARSWVLEYVFQMLTDSNAVAEEALLAGDVDDDVEEEENSQEEENSRDADDSMSEEDDEPLEEVECTCDFCEEMRSYDTLDLNSLNPTESLDRIIVQGMRKALRL